MESASSTIVFHKSRIKVKILGIHNQQDYKFKTMLQLNKFSKLINEMAKYTLELMVLPRKTFLSKINSQHKFLNSKFLISH